ncbi:MAG: hypothetical protein ACI4RD_00095 [Kiritimatiellia bacterium]
MRIALPLLLFVLTAQPLVNEDVLEPSVRNEVDHALSMAPTNAPASRLLPFPTNGLDRTRIAVRLVSEQQSDGRWTVGTNDVTAAAVELLKSL